MVIPCFLSLLWLRHQRKTPTENTVERETVKIADKQAPACRHLKQKTTDHIDEELRLEIFKTEVFPTIFFLLC